MPTTTPAPATPTPPVKRHHRTYTLEVQCEPWAVLPLATMLAERVLAQSNGRLERGMPEAELTLTFESFETSPEPEFGHEWIKQLDDQLLIGFGWSCDEDRRGRPQADNQHVVVTLKAGTRAGDATVRSIVDSWDRDRGALVRVEQEDRADGAAVVVTVTVDGDVTPDELADLVSRLTPLGPTRVVKTRA